MVRSALLRASRTMRLIWCLILRDAALNSNRAETWCAGKAGRSSEPDRKSRRYFAGLSNRLENESFSSWPGLTRPSTSFFEIERKTWMPGTRPGMTSFEESARYSWLHYESDSQDEGPLLKRHVDLG